MKLKIFLMLSVSSICAACTHFSKPKFDTKVEETAIRAVLDAEQIAWNNGDLEGFMEGFWKSDSLQFVSPRGIEHGWQASLDNYQARYPDRAAMGTLSYEIVQITPLSTINFVVMGKYRLTRGIGNIDGVFTLIFKKVDGRWVAIYNHTA